MKVSIIVTSYNYSRYIERCLRSCISQNYPLDEYEVILVDDASTDNTVEILKKFEAFPNFRYIVNPKNLGVAGAANVGISSSFGRYFVRVDADDSIDADLLFFQVGYLEENHDAFCVSCDYYLVDEFGNRLERKYAEEAPIACGIMYRTDRMKKYGIYNDFFRHREEEELRVRLAEYYQIHHIQIPLYQYRMHNKNRTKNWFEMDKYRSLIRERQLRREE